MHVHRKAHIDTATPEVELQRGGIKETLREFRIKKELQPQIQLVPKQRRASTAYGDVPNDLDRIASANTENEMLKRVNQVLELLRRSGRMAELPQELRMDKLSNVHEVRVALRRLQDHAAFPQQVRWESDGLYVLRAVLTTAEERARKLRRQE